jgi:Fic-DOC domain mobile mystery protein B
MPAQLASDRVGTNPVTEEERSRLLPSLSTRAQLDEVERLGVHAARVWAMRATVLARADLFSEGFVRELHRRMFGRIWRGAGQYRTTPRDPGWEAHRIPEGVRMYLDDAEGWLRFSTYPLHEAAVRLHHRLVSMHPWSNGNGRHARLMADIIVAAHGEKPLTWGSRPGAADRGSARERYLDAIRSANAGDMGPLLGFAQG